MTLGYIEWYEQVLLMRRRRGFSQTEFAKRVGVAVPTICLIEQGKRKPSADLLSRICDELDLVIEAAA